MRTLIAILIMIFAIDTWATIAYDDISCVIADHQWLTLAGSALIASVASSIVTRYLVSREQS